MLEVKNKDIFISRGDSESIKIINSATGAALELDEGDAVILAVKKRTSDLKPLFELHADENGDVFFLAEHTKALAFGKYVYDIRHVDAAGRVKHKIRPHEFVVGEVVG